MTQDAVPGLAQEIYDLPDVGRVGLYEFMWELNNTQVSMSDDERRSVARRALDQLLADPELELVWMRWPHPGAVRSATIDEVGPKAWNDIGDDGLYLAIDRGQGAPDVRAVD